MRTPQLRDRRKRDARQLRAFRETFNFTCAELADILGVNERTYRAWEAGETGIPRHIKFIFSFFTIRAHSGD